MSESSGWGWGESEPEIYEPPRRETRTVRAVTGEVIETNNQASRVVTTGKTLADIDFGALDRENLRGELAYVYSERKDVPGSSIKYLGDLEGLDEADLRSVIMALGAGCSEEEKYRRIIDILLDTEIDFGAIDVDNFRQQYFSDCSAVSIKAGIRIGDLECLVEEDLEDVLNILRLDNMPKNDKCRRINAILQGLNIEFEGDPIQQEETAEIHQETRRIIRQENPEQNNSRFYQSTSNKSN